MPDEKLIGFSGKTEKSTLKGSQGAKQNPNGSLLYHCMEGIFDLEPISSTQSYDYA